MKFLCSREELNAEKIIDFLQKFNQLESFRLNKYRDYYDGKQAILRKVAIDKTKPCNKIVTNFCSQITDNYLGYLVGKDVTYTSTEDISALMDILAYNDSRTEDSELLKQALIYGRAFELCYVDEDGQQRFRILDSRETFAIYENNLNEDLLAVVRFYPIDAFDFAKGWMVDVYFEKEVAHYEAGAGFASMTLLGMDTHFYNQVPVSILSLNQEEVSIFDKILSLQDTYNTILSTATDSYEAFSDYYMVIKGERVEVEDLINMKQNRVINLDNTDDEVGFISPAQIATDTSTRLKDIDEQIHKISNSPDFTDDAFGTSSGIAMQYKLLGFENTAGAIAANMTKTLQKRLELLCDILSKVSGDTMWRDVEITFTRNLPFDYATISALIAQLKGTVSDKTLLSLLPFVSDVDKELEMVQETKMENQAIYGFGEVGNEQEEEEPTRPEDR